jgi:hypothetical protein
MVFLSGPINGIRSMITGKVPQTRHVNVTEVTS